MVTPERRRAVDPAHPRVARLIWVLVAIGVLMPLLGVILDFLLRLGGVQSGFLDGIRNLTYPDAEGNVFVWYSTIVLAAVGIGFFLIALVAAGANRAVWPYIVLGAIAVALSADEAAYLHERLDIFVDELGLGSSFTYKWVLLGIPIALAVGALVLVVARRIDRTLRNRLIIAGLVFLAGAVGGELVGGIIKKVDLGLVGELKTIAYGIEVLIEEILEVLGAILAFRAVLLHLDVSNGPEGLAFSLPPEDTRKK